MCCLFADSYEILLRVAFAFRLRATAKYRDIREVVMKFTGMVLLFVGISSLAIASVNPVPEISPASGMAAVALVSGALLVIRGRRKK